MLHCQVLACALLGTVLLAQQALAQASIGCSVPGQCDGVYLSYDANSTEKECAELARNTQGAEYYSFYPVNGICMTFISCENQDTSCTVTHGCISGDKSCYLYDCDIIGLCYGQQLDFVQGWGDQQDCMELCYSTPMCNWWAFYTESYVNGTCSILATCPSVDPRRTHVRSGERNCLSGLPEENLNKVALIGGCSETEGCTAQADVIDFSPAQGNCESLLSFPYEVSEAIGFNLNGVPAVCGGLTTDVQDNLAVSSDCYWYNTTSWLHLGDLRDPRRRAAAVLLADNSLWITGGLNSLQDAAEPLKTSELVVSNGAVNYGPELPLPLANHCSVRLSDTHVALIGGGPEDAKPGDARITYVYNFDDKVWTTMPNMTSSRLSGHVCHIVENSEGGIELLVAGGVDDSGNTLSSTEIYDFVTQRWIDGPDLPEPISHSSLVDIGNTFFTLGGRGSLGASVGSYQWVIETQSWHPRPEASDKYFATTVLMDEADVTCTTPTTVTTTTIA